MYKQNFKQSKYFANCRCKSELKSEYKRLLKIHHPDNGGRLEVMQEINAEYERLFDRLPDVAPEETHDETTGASETISDVLQSILEKIRTIPGIIIELCGSWIWVNGDTYSVKENLKQLGFRFSSKKKMWYFHEESETFRYRKKREKSMEDIRDLYGSKKVNYNMATALS